MWYPNRIRSALFPELHPFTARQSRILTLVLTLWVLIWVVLGLLTAAEIRNLTTVSDSVVQSGSALDTAGRALQALDRLPVVGQRSKRLGDEVRDTAEEVQEAGATSRRSVRSVSVLVGAALVLIPIVPVVGLYAPLRLSLARQRRRVAKALDDRPDPLLEQFLAHRALQHLPYDVLRRVSDDPWGDFERGSYRRLANAELTRLGLEGKRGRQAPERSAPDPDRGTGLR